MSWLVVIARVISVRKKDSSHVRVSMYIDILMHHMSEYNGTRIAS